MFYVIQMPKGAHTEIALLSEANATADGAEIRYRPRRHLTASSFAELNAPIFDY